MQCRSEPKASGFPNQAFLSLFTFHPFSPGTGLSPQFRLGEAEQKAAFYSKSAFFPLGDRKLSQDY